MSARPSPSVSARTTNPSSLLFQPSTTGWYAAWKARKDGAAPTPTSAAEPEAAPAAGNGNDASEALARWLTGNDGK
jgi:hypothetical protein